MATAAVVARPPAQALRRARPTLPLKRPSVVLENSNDITTNGPKRRKMNEPHVRRREDILRKFAGKLPSLVVHLHPNYFRFDSQEGHYGYDSPMRPFIQAMRESRVPHEMLEELLINNVPFYDGCLIVELHNHRTAGAKTKGRHDTGAGDDQVRNSMHNYNNYITPSPYARYPNKAKEEAAPDKSESTDSGKDKARDGSKDKDGPTISTIVLFPNDLTREREMQILARTPMSDLKIRRKGADMAQPPTPQLAVPATPLANAANRSSPNDNQMCLEEKDFYQFQAEVLLATEPPLILQPVDGPESAQKIMDMLENPAHQRAPPSPKTRKRTTAEMAADELHAAEEERRMLMMDERIKPSNVAATGENANTAALGFGRFKTIQMVRENVEEKERQKKEEEAQAALQRRQQEEANAVQQQTQRAQQERQRQVMAQRQTMARQQAEQFRAQAAMQAQQAALLAQQNLAQQGNMMMGQQQNNFQHPASVAQSSPVVRNQTPSMMNSSPMVAQGGFPMTATTSQGAGSPPRPTSATMAGNPMARQVSQQQHPSRNNTPQISQATPNMPTMPNGARQISQTPRMAHGSPAPGTPVTNGLPNMSTPQQAAAMTPEQFAMLQQAHARQQQQMAGQTPNGMSTGHQNQTNMTPEQIQNIRQQHHQFRNQALLQQAQGNPQLAQQLAQRQAMIMRQQQAQIVQQQRLMQQQQNAQSGSPHPQMQVTPQMGHAHPQGADGQQMTPQQRQQQQQLQLQRAQVTLAQLTQQYQGLMNVPAQVVNTLPGPVQVLLRQQAQRQQAARAQAMAHRAQQAQNQGQAVAGTSGGDPEYMQTLRAHQAMLAQQQAQQQGNMGMGMSMAGNMNMGNQQFNQNQNSGDLSAHIQAMQRALNNQNQGGGMQ